MDTEIETLRAEIERLREQIIDERFAVARFLRKEAAEIRAQLDTTAIPFILTALAARVEHGVYGR